MKADLYIIENPPERLFQFNTIKYKIEIKMNLTENGKNSSNTMSYELEIEYGGSNFFNQWKRNNIKVNTKKVLKKMDRLYIKSATPINNLDFSCNNEGQIEKIYNHKEILKKWKKTKASIQKEYTGNAVDVNCNILEKNYNDKQILCKNLSQDLVLQTIYKAQLDDYLIYYGSSIKSVKYLGLIKNRNLDFKQKNTLSYQNEKLHLNTTAQLDMDKINIEQHFPQVKLLEEEFKVSDISAEVKGNFELDYKTIWIENATIDFNLEMKKLGFNKSILLSINKV